MNKYQNLVGLKLNRLTILEVLPTQPNHTKKKKRYIHKIKCLCDCGKITINNKYDILYNKIKSCGCFRDEMISALRFKGEGIVGFNNTFRSYESSAKYRNIIFSLTKDQFRILTQQNCYYCGIEPKQESPLMSINTSKETRKKGLYIYNGIDRIDNTKGYILENCITCCKQCNYSKKTRTQQEFFKWIKKVYQNLSIKIELDSDDNQK